MSTFPDRNTSKPWLLLRAADQLLFCRSLGPSAEEDSWEGPWVASARRVLSMVEVSMVNPWSSTRGAEPCEAPHRALAPLPALTSLMTKLSRKGTVSSLPKATVNWALLRRLESIHCPRLCVME